MRENNDEMRTHYCPCCGNNTYVILIKQTIKIANAVGAGAALGAVTGFFFCAKVGHEVGREIDKNMICKYRCNKCGKEFETRAVTDGKIVVTALFL